jgi:hypothetical protein
MSNKPRSKYPADHFADVAAGYRSRMALLAESVGETSGRGGFASPDGTVVFSHGELEELRKACFWIKNIRAMISSQSRCKWLQRISPRKRKSALVDWLIEREAKHWVEALNSDEED